MKILTLGCSHSDWSVLRSRTWADLLVDRYPEHQFRVAASAGAGNEFNLQKLIFELSITDYDLVLFQLTETSRLTLGTFMTPGKYTPMNNIQVGTSTFYTFNVVNNERNLKRLLGKEYSVDAFFLEHAIVSTFNMEQKVASTLLAADAAVKAAGSRVIFWSWFTPADQLIKNTGCSRLLRHLQFVPGWPQPVLLSRRDWVSPCGHFNEEAHAALLDEWLLPELTKMGVSL